MPVPRQQTSPAVKKAVNKKSSGDPISRIRPVTVPDELKILLFGDSGTGKTRVWSSFPGKILVALASCSDRPGELLSVDYEDRKKIDEVVLKESPEIVSLAEHAASGKYKTMVIDNLTGFQDLVLGEVLGRDIPEQKSFNFCGRDQWGECSKRTKHLLRLVLDLPIHVVIIAHQRDLRKRDTEGDLIVEEDPTNEVGSIPYIGAGVQPAVCNWIHPAVSYSCFTYIRRKTSKLTNVIDGKKVITEVQEKGVEFCMRTGASEKYMTKFRVPKGVPELPMELVNPTFDKILALRKSRS